MSYKLKRLFFLAITALLVFNTSAVSLALDDGELNSLNGNTVWYAPTLSSTCSAGIPILSGSSNEDKTWNYFKGQGLSDAQVAGIMGNLEQESGFNPTIMEIGGQSNNPADADPKGWGLIQWTPGSKVIDMEQQAGIEGPIYDLATQLALVWQHMNNHPVVTKNFDLNYFKSISSETDAAQYFLNQIEAGTDPSGVREQYATTVLQQYTGTVSTGGSGSSFCGGSLSPDCQSADGVAKILCAAKAYDTVSYSETTAGGHQGGAAWHDSCPTIGPSCVLDCSGLVNLAVYDAFGKDLTYNTVGEANDTATWQHITLAQLKPGDLIQPGDLNGNHVEIVDHIVGNTIYTFGAHTASAPQEDQIGPSSYTASPGDLYLHFTGANNG